MRVEHGDRGQPAGITDAEHADAAVVALHGLQQPVDGVVRVRRLVDRLRVVRIAGRAGHDERAFRLEPPANVLEREGVPVVDEFLERSSRKLRSARPSMP